MKNTSYKRLLLVEKGISIFFLLNLAIIILGKNVLLSVFPLDVRNYFFWLSMGLYLGFLLCKNEYKKILAEVSK